VPPGRTRAHSVTRQPSRSSLAGPSNGSPPHIISPQVQVPLRVRLARSADSTPDTCSTFRVQAGNYPVSCLLDRL